jgi:uncharacterized protein (TIGR02466 family)
MVKSPGAEETCMSLNVMRDIQFIFPTPVYTATNVCIDIIDNLKKETYVLRDKYKTIRTPSLNVDSSHQTASKNIFNHFYFSRLKTELQKHVNDFVESLGGYNDPVEITNMWFNCSNKSDFNFPHSHGGSVISGVYYIESEADSYLRFYNNTYLVANAIPPNNVNESSFPAYDIPCEKGKLLMWQGHVIHGNPAQILEGEKIAVSFNTSFIINK